jgi:hypothetical protein
MDFILSILSNLASSWLGKLNIPRLFPDSKTKFWDPIFKGGLVIVTPDSEEEAKVKSQVFDFQGLDELKANIVFRYYKDTFKQATCLNVSNEWLHRNLLLVAGPIPNTITRHILNKENDSVRYYFEGNHIADKKNPKGTIKGILGPQGYPQIDYGIISKLRNPFNREKWVVIASGMYGWGTFAALLSLTKKDILDFLNQDTTKREFQVLIQTRVYNRLSEDPILIKESLHIVTDVTGERNE